MRRGFTFYARLFKLLTIQKRYEAVEYGVFFSVFDPFMIKKLKPRFFEFRGFGLNSTSNNSVDQSCIFLKLSF